ncbi:MAG TPA: hypothetical protein VFX97_16775 [Pyrinomonadaceae bacterium]|nr:hypothetical protein [Pyrinomonadaceae bacterium]
MAPLAAVKPKARIVWRVGMHSPGLQTYRLWARWLIRFVYFVTGYQVTAHDIGVADSEEEARSWLLDKNYFAKPVYLGVPLGKEGQGPGTVIWGDAKVNDLYAKHSPDLVTLTRDQFEALGGAVEGVCRTAHAR